MRITMSVNSPNRKTGLPKWVNHELVNYLTLTPDPGCVDLEEREWSLMATAEQLKIVLAGKGIQWQIPMIEHRVRHLVDTSGRQPVKQLTLMLRLHPKLTWTDYENAVKASLKLRKDFWVVRTKFETIRRNNCLSLQIRGSHQQIDETLNYLQQYAREQNHTALSEYFIIYHNDEEQVPEKDLLTTILLPLNH